MNSYSDPMVTYNEIIEALKAILDCSKSNGYLDEYSFLNARYDVLNKSPLYEEQEQALIQAIQSLEKTIDAADKVIRENLKSVLSEIVNSNSFMIPTKYKKDEEYRKLAAQDEFVTKLKEMSLPLEVLSDVPPMPEQEETLDEIESVANPFEEVEIESLNVASLEEEESQDEVYYSRVKLGNVKNAFAVTEEQYYKLKQSDQEPEELAILPEVEENLEPVPEEKEEPETVLEEKEEPKEEEFTDSLTEEPKAEPKKENVEENPSTTQSKVPMDRIKLIKKALDKAKEKENEQLVKILEQQLKKEIEALKS